MKQNHRISSKTVNIIKRYTERSAHSKHKDKEFIVGFTKGLSTREAGRGHATPHMPVKTAKCWWLLKIEPNAWEGGKGSCTVCVDLQAVGALEFFGELYSLAKGFGPFLSGVWAGFREREGSIFSNHQHFAVYVELHALSSLRGSISPWFYPTDSLAFSVELLLL